MFECSHLASSFIRPSSDGSYYGMVMSVRPSAAVRPDSVRVSVRQSQIPHFSATCFDVLSLNFVCHFIFINIRSSLSIVNFRHFLVMPFWNFESCKCTVFTFASCFDILSWKFAYAFVWLYYRSSSSFVNLRQCLREWCPFWRLEYLKFTLLLLALTYWAKIMQTTLFYCTADQVLVSSICVNFCGSYAPFGT